MKVIFATCAFILVLGGFLIWQWLNRPILIGEFTNAPKVAVIDVIKHPQDYLHKTVALEGIVAKQCTTMGCYFFLIVGEKELKIDLADIAMNGPKGKNGHRVRVEGRTMVHGDNFSFMASAVEFQ